MATRKITMVMIGIWLCIVLALLLMPAPGNWGKHSWFIFIHYNDFRDVLQPVIHFLLMAGFAFLLMHLFVCRRLGEAIVYASVIASSVAGGLELLQGVLPEWFCRESDPHDLIPSLAGIAAGVFSGWVSRSCSVLKNKKSEP